MFEEKESFQNLKILKRTKTEKFLLNNQINNNQSNKTLASIIKMIFKKFEKKYNHMPEKYENNIIDSIIYNDKIHLVSIFKDQLINNDFTEYLKRCYELEECFLRIPKYCEYYFLYSKLFPNYTTIPEGKYFYLNIQKKQRMIDIQEQMENEQLQKLKDNNKIDNQSKHEVNVFNSTVLNSILNRTNKEEMEILFGLNYEKNEENELIFTENVNKLIDLINSYEIKDE